MLNLTTQTLRSTLLSSTRIIVHRCITLLFCSYGIYTEVKRSSYKLLSIRFIKLREFTPLSGVDNALGRKQVSINIYTVTTNLPTAARTWHLIIKQNILFSLRTKLLSSCGYLYTWPRAKRIEEK